MLIAVAGKSNTGKTTFFSAATLVDAEISNRIFTTISPNKGIAFVRSPCPCAALGTRCNPRNSACRNGTRLVPINLIDVAGLVPGAHEGRGLGNQFLTDVMQADALIHVIDVSGSTDADGNPVPAGSRDPEEDIIFFEKELDHWMLSILNRSVIFKRDIKEKEFIFLLHKQLTGLGISLERIEHAARETALQPASSEAEYLRFIALLRRRAKPILVAGNKIDKPGAGALLEKLKKSHPGAYPCSAAFELALRKAAEKRVIDYLPGDSSFAINNADAGQQHALALIREFLNAHGSTGVQHILDIAVFSLLDMIAVYPVENEHRFSDKKGNVLPDVFLLKRGSTALDLAYRVHEDIGKKFISAIDAKTRKAVSASYELQHNDVISIKAGR